MTAYPLGTLVAFSGEVADPDETDESVTENSARLNPLLKGRDMRKAFSTDDYQILLLANKSALQNSASPHKHWVCAVSPTAPSPENQFTSH